MAMAAATSSQHDAKFEAKPASSSSSSKPISLIGGSMSLDLGMENADDDDDTRDQGVKMAKAESAQDLIGQARSSAPSDSGSLSQSCPEGGSLPDLTSENPPSAASHSQAGATFITLANVDGERDAEDSPDSRTPIVFSEVVSSTSADQTTPKTPTRERKRFTFSFLDKSRGNTPSAAVNLAAADPANAKDLPGSVSGAAATSDHVESQRDGGEKESNTSKTPARWEKTTCNMVE